MSTYLILIQSGLSKRHLHQANFIGRQLTGIKQRNGLRTGPGMTSQENDHDDGDQTDQGPTTSSGILPNPVGYLCHRFLPELHRLIVRPAFGQPVIRSPEWPLRNATLLTPLFLKIQLNGATTQGTFQVFRPTDFQPFRRQLESMGIKNLHSFQ